MFDLKRPCKNCPFLMENGPLYRMSARRLAEIFEAPAFQCHKTLDHSHQAHDKRAGDNPQQCAGLMALLTLENKPNQIMQVATRLGHLDPRDLALDRVYPSFDAAREGHGCPENEDISS